MTNPHAAHATRNLYFTRTLVQLVWAVLVLTSVARPAETAVLLVLYPLWDVACTVFDLGTTRPEGSARATQIANIALGVGTAIAAGLTVRSQPRYAVAAFGVWALLAGALQLVVGLKRRQRLGGGQWAMVLSGTQSVLAGTFIALGGLHGTRHASDLGGYAIFGGVYFLIAGILLSRRLRQPAGAVAS